MATGTSQGPWTRIRPLQRHELDVYTHAGMKTAELTWGSFPNNLGRTMSYCPRLMETEVEYCNSFIFDQPTYRQRSEFDEPDRNRTAPTSCNKRHRCVGSMTASSRSW